MGKGSAPSAPDPYSTAQAQYEYGTQAANYNKALNATNEVTPYGSTTWSVQNPAVTSVHGGVRNIDAYGNPTASGPPQYTETQTLSPNEQALLTGREQLGLGAAGNAGSALSNWQLPTEAQNGQFGGQAMQSAYGLETATMDPHWNQQQESLDASLRNSGAHPGDPAYDNAMREFEANRTAAYGQAENQAFGQGLSAMGQEISDVNAAQGGQLSNFLSLTGQGNPSTGMGAGAGGAGSSVSAPDIMSAFQNQYQGQLAGYNANVASGNAEVGAGAGLAAAAIIAL
jgi:hypothetical protein